MLFSGKFVQVFLWNMANAENVDYSHLFAATPSFMTAPHVVQSLPDLSAVIPNQCSRRGRKPNSHRRSRHYKRPKKTYFRVGRKRLDENEKQIQQERRKLKMTLTKSSTVYQMLKSKNRRLSSRLHKARMEKKYLFGEDNVGSNDDGKSECADEDMLNTLKSNAAKLEYINKQIPILEVENKKLAGALNQVNEQRAAIILNENIESCDEQEVGVDSDYEPGI